MQYDQNLGGPCLEANGVKAELRLSIVVSRCYRSKLREPPQVWRRHQFLCLAGAFFRPGGARPPTQIMVDFIHNNKDLYGVDAICRILPIAASTYYRTLDLADNPEHRAKRDLHDEHHAEQIQRIWKESSGRYGVRKVWQQLKREGYIIARCTVARLMQKLGIQGVWRGKNKQTTRSRDDQKRAPDLVKRNFRADQPNHLWVADFSVPQQAAEEMRVWPLAIGLQEQVANHHKRLGSKVPVVSVMEKAS